MLLSAGDEGAGKGRGGAKWKGEGRGFGGPWKDGGKREKRARKKKLVAFLLLT